MRPRASRIPLLAGLLTVLACAGPCFEAESAVGAAPRSFDAPGLAPLEFVPHWTAPPVDVAGLIAEDEAASGKDRPPRIGYPMKAPLAADRAGLWEDLPGGDRIWRVSVSSPGALWVVLGFAAFRPEPGAEMWVYSPDRDLVLGPFTAEDERDHGELWLPPLAADRLLIEIDWPRGARDLVPAIRLGTLSHGYKPWGPAGGGKTPGTDGQSGSCNIDVACPLGADWQDEKRGVVRLLSGGSSYCTASMIATTAADCRNFVLSAAHCLNSAGEANSTTFQFNFERPQCGSGSAPTNQTVTGSTLRATYGASDFTLVELNGAIPESFNAYYNGWSRSTSPAPMSWVIHHPSGDVKKISHDDDPLTNGTNYGADHWRVANYEQGTTEGGSSGSPLFDPAGRIVGQLHGGTASCSSITWDEYGKVDVSWTGGGTNGSRLSSWLDPGGTGKIVQDGIDAAFCRVPRPSLAYTASAVDDAAGNGDGIADPGESFRLRVDVANDGNLGATGVTGALSTTTPLVAVTDTASDWPDVPAGTVRESAPPHFGVALDPAIECGTGIAFHLDMAATEDPQSWPSDFTLRVGSPVVESVFADDLEAGPGNFTPQTVEGGAAWSLVTSSSASPTHSWFVNDPSSRSEALLTMRTLDALPADAELRFSQRYDTETGWDGGVLEYSAEGGPFVDAGALIVTGGYLSSINGSAGSALAGRNAWTGLSDGWTAVVVDLSSLAGRSVRFRWRFASDESVGGQGWWVDDVVVDSTHWSCRPAGALPGEASDPRGGGTPFTIRRQGGSYRLEWSAPPAGGTVDGYSLYRTPLGGVPVPSCETDLGSGTSALLAALTAQRGFLVVARNPSGEGSYGRDSRGSERLPASAADACP